MKRWKACNDKIMLMTKKKILIVDDDKFLLDMYALKFGQNEEFAVNTALGSEEALQKLKEGLAPDVVLLDIVMPKMSGLELLEKIKTEKISEKSKIIILSNLGQDEDIAKAKSLQADGYIIKSNATPSEVLKKVLEFVSPVAAGAAV